ncbi:MAG: DUF3552 domain-containing protein, partial [Chloroflexi bacterium]|nr:DUF3552 domain-containing protein [Chloroflexota bacterium]
MDLALTAVITALLVGVLAGGLSFYLRGALITRGQEAARAAAEQQIRRADARSKEILLEAREHGIKTRTALEAETRAERQELQRLETRVEQREETLGKRAGALEERDRSLERLQEQLEGERTDLEEVRQREDERLEEISGLSATDARQMLMDRAEEAIEFDLARRYRDAEVEARERSDVLARDVLAGARQRLASD